MMEYVEIPVDEYNSVTVPVVLLLQWKHAIGLEMRGLRHSKGSVCAHVKRVFNLPMGLRRQKVHDWLCDLLDQIEAQRAHLESS